jgi:hypothetical protein
MATNISVYLADLPKSASSRDEVKSALQGFFDQTIGKHKLDVSVNVSWADSKPSLGEKDLLVYFVKSVGDTVLGGGGMIKDYPPSSNDGWTVLGKDKATGSEVYMSRLKDAPGLAARLALHELMHNMSRTGDAMHKPGMSIGAETVDPKAALSGKDMEYIAAHLAKTARSQWDGGYSYYHDPLRGGL